MNKKDVLRWEPIVGIFIFLAAMWGASLSTGAALFCSSQDDIQTCVNP